MNKTSDYDYTLIYIIFIMIVSYILFLLLPAENTIAYILEAIVYWFPLPVTTEIKTSFSKSLVKFTMNTRNAVIELLRFLLVNTAYLLPDSILRAFIQSFPNTYINPKQCIKKPIKHFENVIVQPSDLPWDEKINECIASGGTIDDIDFNANDLDQRVKSAKPQIIIY